MMSKHQNMSMCAPRVACTTIARNIKQYTRIFGGFFSKYRYLSFTSNPRRIHVTILIDCE